MNIANSISFLVFGIIMRLLPVLAPTFVASDASSIAAAEASSRGLWLIAMGYVFSVIGVWFVAKDMSRRGALALARARVQLQAYREYRVLARERAIHVRTVAARIAVRVQY